MEGNFSLLIDNLTTTIPDSSTIDIVISNIDIIDVNGSGIATVAELPSGSGSGSGNEEVVDDSDCAGTGQLYNYLMLGLFVFGTIGNFASVGVMRRPALRRRSGSPALCVLVFVNTLGLFFNAVSSFDDVNSTMNLLYQGSMEAYIGPIGCKLLRYVPAVIQLMGHWVVVYITAQRFVAICLPKKQNVVFLDRKARPVFSIMFLVVAATQLWRPYLDTQEPATYTNGTDGTLVLESPAICTAEELGTYIDLESFFYQLGLLFLLPAVLIAVMNTGVIVKLYQDYNHNRRIQRRFDRSVKQLVRLRSPDPISVAFIKTSGATPRGQERIEGRNANAFLDEMGTSGKAPLERKLKKATIVLLAVTCTFWLYILPHLFLLMYVRFNEAINGRLAGYNAFMHVCKALNVTSFLATISSADYLIIQLIFDDMFRLELKFIIYRLFGMCFLRCQYLYIRERQLNNRRRVDTNSKTADGTDAPDQQSSTENNDGNIPSQPGSPRRAATNLIERRSLLAVPVNAAHAVTQSFYVNDDDLDADRNDSSPYETVPRNSWSPLSKFPYFNDSSTQTPSRNWNNNDNCNDDDDNNVIRESVT